MFAEGSEAVTTSAVYHMRRIRLEPARARGDAGAPSRAGIEFVAPLDAEGHISVEGWRHERGICFVHRLENGAMIERGVLVHKPGGQGGSTWAFEYADGGDEETGYRFGAHAFTQGEYVSIRDEDGELQTYRVAQIGPV